MKRARISVLGAAATVLTLGLGASGPVAADGAALAKKHNCTACHAVDHKLVGPAFKDIAAKYKGDAAAKGMLVKKVREGGSGTWGQVPMPPNPSPSDEELNEIVGWVLGQ